MSRILTLMFVLAFSASPAFARDDGGFSSTPFPPSAPAALGDYVAGDISESPANIEPAAGDEEDVAPTEEKLDAESTAATDTPVETPAPEVDTPDTSAAPQE